MAIGMHEDTYNCKDTRDMRDKDYKPHLQTTVLSNENQKRYLLQIKLKRNYGYEDTYMRCLEVKG